jgi:cytochrome c553
MDAEPQRALVDAPLRRSLMSLHAEAVPPATTRGVCMRRGSLVLMALLWAAIAQAQIKVPDTIEQRLKACAACHGDKGEGLQNKNEHYPRLAGKPAGYLYNQLVNFRDKRRELAIMNYMVAFLSDNYLLEIAAYYAALQPPLVTPPSRASAALMAQGEKLVREGDAARGLPSCVACHGANLTGIEPAIPGLLGLQPPYIVSQMGAWKVGKRHAMKPDCMREVADKLTPDDVAALTAWLVAQPLPADPKPAAVLPKLPLDCGGLTPKAK